MFIFKPLLILAFFCLTPQADLARRNDCQHRAISSLGTAYAWSDHPYAAPRDPELGAPFYLVVRLAQGRDSLIDVAVSRGEHRWQTILVPEAPSRVREGPASYRAIGAPPMWLDSIDSIDVCLMQRGTRPPKVIRLARIAVVQTS